MESHLTTEYRNALLREFDRFIGDFSLAADMMRADLRRPEKFSVREAVVEILAADTEPGDAALSERDLQR